MSRHWSLLLVTLLLIAGLLGCGGGLGAGLPRLATLPIRPPTSAFDLAPVADCDARLEQARQEVIRLAVAWIDEERHRHIGVCSGSMAPSYGGYSGYDDFGYGGYGEDEDGYGYEFTDDPLTSGGFGPNNATIRVRPGPTARAPSGGAVAEEVSGSNLQVVGVDEADIVKNDNKHVYILAHDQLRIVQAWPPESARVVGKANIVGEPLRLFVTESEAVVFSSVGPEATNQTHVTVFDIRDRSQPRRLRELWLPGAYVAARRIGTAVHVVVSQQRYPVLEQVWRWGLPPGLCRPDLDDIYDGVRDRIVDYIESTDESVWLPTVAVSEGGGPPTRKVGCNRYGRPKNDIDATTSVVSFDIRGGEPSMVSVVERPGVVYASPKHLYLTVTDRTDELEALARHHPSTKDAFRLSAVHRFKLDGPVAQYSGSGLIGGEPINQFAMDEHEGRLRVATHNGSIGSDITVLGDSGGSWVIEGWLGDIAPDEEIRSVRFVGDRGYLVTFRVIDPLFAFDLTGGQPHQLGELKIPGYATYIHPLSNDQLLTVGFGASEASDDIADIAVSAPDDDDDDDDDARGPNDEVRLQLVDVRDPTKPRLAHVEVIGSRGSQSAAQSDHLAFNYFSTRDLLLLPINVNMQRVGDPDSRFTGLMAYRANMQDGFQLLGQVANAHGWRTKRTIVMDDYVLSLTDQTLKINRLSNLTQVVAEIPLTD